MSDIFSNGTPNNSTQPIDLNIGVAYYGYNSLVTIYTYKAIVTEHMTTA